MTPRRLAAATVVGLVVVGVVLATNAQATPTPPTPATATGPHATPSPAPAPSAPPGGIGLGGGLQPGATPTPTPTPPPTTGAGGGGCGLLDVSCHVQGAINGWFKSLVRSALNPVLSLLSRSVLATPDVTGMGRISDLWSISAGIANGVFVLFIVVGGLLVMGHETLQSRYTVKDILPRVVVAGIAANTSLSLAGVAIHFANVFAQTFLAGGLDVANTATAMTQMILAPLSGGGIFLILCGLVTAVLGVTLLCTYIVRIALVVLLVAGAPLMLACHALPQTEGLARLWWRAFAGCLGVQIVQSIVLVAALRVFFTPTGHSVLGLPSAGGLVDMLVAACLLWLLLRVPAWVSRLVFSGSSHRQSVAARVVKTAIVYKAIQAGMAAVAL
jgi:hypothetical protein